jgi:hypothetical protein
MLADDTAYVCPIALEPIVVPVCTEVGSVYEMDSIVGMGTAPARDPLTGQPLPHWPAFRYAKIEPGLFSLHVRENTVNTALRSWCVETLVKPMLDLGVGVNVLRCTADAHQAVQFFDLRLPERPPRRERRRTKGPKRKPVPVWRS